MNIGDQIDGRYRLERLLGEGGMAAVYLAQDQRLERAVAIKLLFGSGGRLSPAAAEQFLREARIAGSIRHPNIVQVLDFGTHTGNIPYMVMEALEGEAMADRYSRGYRFQIAEVVAITLGCLEGLAAVHAAGIVHRDLKPENIFLTRGPVGEVPKLIDFGISRAADKSTGLRSAVTTREGHLLGTPEYMSPEQARGLADIDLRTDIYSLGVVMYEALWGRAPFESKNEGDLMVMVIAGNATPLADRMADMPAELSTIVSTAMMRDRDARYPSATAMHQALRAAWDAMGKRGLLPRLGAVAATSPGVEPAPSIEHTLSGLLPQIATENAPRRSAQSRLMLIAGVGLAAVAGVGSFFALQGEPAPAASAPRYIVVQSSGSAPGLDANAAEKPPAPEPAAQPVEAAALPAQPAATTPSPVRPAPRPASRPSSVDKPTSGADQGRALARRFEQQKAPVVTCLRENLQAISGQAELSVRIEVDASGAVKRATVMPDAVAGSPVGACIVRAVKSMSFGAQPAAVAFRVPLTIGRS